MALFLDSLQSVQALNRFLHLLNNAQLLISTKIALARLLLVMHSSENLQDREKEMEVS